MNISNRCELNYENGSIQKAKKLVLKINEINEYICDEIMSTSFKTSATQNTKIYVEQLNKLCS